MTPLRKYEAIWQQIKLKGGCKIAAPNRFHKRIKKAVTKEIGRDEDFREDQAAKGITSYYVRKICEQDRITFILKNGKGFEDFGVSTADIVALELEEINLEDFLK